MRCLSCDVILTDREATRRVQSTGEFLDFCDSCYESIKEEVKTLGQTGEELEEELLE